MTAAAPSTPLIVIDTREQDPLPFTVPTTPGTLQSGDYSFIGAEHLFAIERKSIPDLVACCMGANRDRFERELHRLRGFRFKRLLIIGTCGQIARHEYRSRIEPKSVMHTLAAFQARYEIPVLFMASPSSAARQVLQWAWWFAREIVNDGAAVAAGMEKTQAQETDTKGTEK